MFKLITLAVASVVPALHCAPVSAPADRPAKVIHVGEHYAARIDARHGDVIIITMDAEGDWVTRCNDMGGEPIANPYTLVNECDGVDF